MNPIATLVIGYGVPWVMLCDARCDKAWGINGRPKYQLSDNEDDYEYLADHELGTAPADPGTCEGSDAKPLTPKHNKWCFRECERCEQTAETFETIRPRDFSTRQRNIPE